MAIESSDLVSLSQKLLIAADQSYAGAQLVVGKDVLFRLADEPFFDKYTPPFESLFPGYVVAFTADDRRTGFKCVIYRNDASREIIVAMAGTDGQNLKDWWSNLTHYGWNQWNENRGQVLSAIDGLASQLTDPLGGNPKIYFTGQSLGGALAEYSAYQFVTERPQYGASNLSLVTFNGLGGIAALRQHVPDFDPFFVEDFSHIVHYASLNDLIPRLGEGHLGKDVYSFEGRNFSKLIPGSNTPYLLDTINAHRIETGFYYPLSALASRGVSEFQASLLRGRLPEYGEASFYLRVNGLQEIASLLGNIFRQTGTTTAGAMFHLLFGGLGTLVLADSREVNTLVREYVLTRFRAGMYEGKAEEFEAALETDWSMRLRIGATTLALSNTLTSPFGWVVKVVSGIALAPIYTLLEGLVKDDVQPVFEQFEAEREDSLVPDSPWEEALERSSYVGAALNITEPGNLPLGTIGEIVGDDIDAFAEQMVAGEDWRHQTAAYLSERGTELGRHEETQLALNEFWRYSLHNAGNNQALVASIWNDFEQFTTQWGGAVASLNDELLAPRDTVLNLVSPTQYAEKSKLWGAVLTGLEGVLDLFVGTAHAEEARATVRDAIEEVRGAAESVVVQSGRPGNPFDDPAFDPELSATTAADLEEGSIRTFTVYLPYAAGEAGQRIKLKLAGTLAAQVTIYGDEGRMSLDAEGAFTLKIAEGQREGSFAMVADGAAGLAGPLELSAQLLDSAGVATHESDDEATIDFMVDGALAPASVREVRGDWAPKPYVDEETGETYYKYEILGATFEDQRNNTERMPGVPNTMGFQERDSKLDGSSDADHIVTGDYEDWVQAYEGDDHVVGSDLIGTIVFAGPGDDWVEARGYAEHEADYGEFEYLGRSVRLGEDQIFGGPGNDRLYGESQAAVGALYDAQVAPTGRPGDWINGGTGDDRIYGGAGDDVLLGGVGEDRLVGGAGMDVLLGDDEFLIAVPGNHWRVVHPVFGDHTPGFGDFEVGLFPVNNYFPILTTDVNPITFDPYVSYYKQGGADVLLGGAGRDILIGQFGDDFLYGGEDEDILAGWEGADEIFGGTGDDLMAGDFGRYEQPEGRSLPARELVVAGLLGAPELATGEVDQVGNDFLDGGAGNDLIFGEGGDDVILGGAGVDTLHGDATYLPESLHGHDFMDGGAGDDTLFGHGGDDTLRGGEGNDSLAGGKGDDRLEGDSGNDILQGDEGDDALRGGSGEDDLAGGEGADELHGGAGDDTLIGGLGDDAIHGESGDDQLQGGIGDDTLHGDSGSDSLAGGEGDDLLDGGTGTDVLEGGEGDDTYVVAPGYGHDQIQDSAGTNRLRFAPGIRPHDLTADLDPASLWAKLSFGVADSITFHAASLSEVQFANGITWTRSDLANFLPAKPGEGSSGDDVLIGNPDVRNQLDGGAGADTITGAGFRDVLTGGAGSDSLDGLLGSDTYAYATEEGGIDLLKDSGVAARAYLEWYYRDRGILDWEERARFGGMYRAGAAAGGFVEYFDTLEEASRFHEAEAISYVEPLTDIAPLVGRDDAEALAELEAEKILDRDAVHFGPGLSLNDLALTVTVLGTSADQNPGQPWHGGGLLSVRWGESAGFDLEVPSTYYGYDGSDWLHWEAYRLGSGVEEFQFSDGWVYALEDILQLASVVRVYDYAVERGSGEHSVAARDYTGIAFGEDVSADAVAIQRSDDDLLVELNDLSATVRIEGWFALPPEVPPVSLRFADGVVLDALQVTRIALTQEGSGGDDVLYAQPKFPGMLLGNDGDDELHGAEGDDILVGGAGDDELFGGPGSDTYVYVLGDGNDYIAEDEGGSDPDDVDTLRLVDIDADDLTLERDDTGLYIGVESSDEMLVVGGWSSEPGAVRIERVIFDDGTVWTVPDIALRARYIGVELVGTEADDHLVGLEGDDSLFGGEGNDLLAGGPGDDYLDGGEGDDAYEYAPGDGRDDIYDEAEGGLDVLRFDASLSPTDIGVTQEFGALFLYVLGTGDRVMLGEMSEEAPAGGIEQVEFADGTVWTADELLERAVLLPASPYGDVLWGTDDGDVLDGLAGDDVLYGNGGADVLEGGAGDDYLEGGAGDDLLRGGHGDDQLSDWEGGTTLMEGAAGSDHLHYEGPAFVIGGADDDWIDNYGSGSVIAFNVGDGHDTVYAAEAFTLSVGGAAAADLSLSVEADDVVLWVGGDDSIRFTREWEEDPAAWPQVTLQLFGSVHFYDFNAVIDAFHAAVDEDGALEAFELGSILPSYELHVSEDRALGGILAWSYGTTGTLAEVSREEILSVLGDADFGMAPQAISSEGANEPPELQQPIGDYSAEEDAVFRLVLPVATFSDPDPNDALTYTTGDLPAWLSFDPETRTFSGTPEQADVGTVTVTVVATDAAGLSASTEFDVTVANVNDTPVPAAPLADQAATEDAAFAFVVPEGSFADEDLDDALSWFAARPDGDALPSWLRFDAATRAFSGTPGNEDVGAVEVEVTVVDAAGLAASGTFTLTVENVNDAPVLESPLADVQANEDAPFVLTVPEDTFADVDADDTLALGAAGLPAWLAFDAESRTFTGTPRNADVGAWDIFVSASDASGALASDSFRIEVANVNDAPTVVKPLSDRAFVAGSMLTFTVPAGTFADEDAGDTLALSAGSLPTWLAFDPGTGVFIGNPGKKENGIWQIVVTASDRAGVPVSDDFSLVIEAMAGAAVVGGGGDDALYGGQGSQALIAKGGNDALFGGGGNDLLHGGSGENLLDGGAGNDLILDGRGSSLIAGGTGNDLIHTGAGRDVLLFNRGDGSDTVIGDRRSDNTLSFGGGITSEDLALSRRGRDLIVNAGESDRVVLKDWYAGKRSIANLQFVSDAGEVQRFDFLGLVGAFDGARRASPGLTSWQVTNALLQFHLAGADDAALGGDLAYWYARNRGFAGLSVETAQQVIGAPGFGADAQSLRPFTGLQEGFAKLA